MEIRILLENILTLFEKVGGYTPFKIKTHMLIKIRKKIYPKSFVSINVLPCSHTLVPRIHVSLKGESSCLFAVALLNIATLSLVSGYIVTPSSAV